MAMEEWKVLVQEGADEVVVRCVRARGVLADAVPHLALPMHVADAQAVRARVEVVRSMVPYASKDLALAASAMAGVEIFALRGSAFNPMTPLPSIQYIPDGDHDVRLALSLYQSARDCAEDACNSVESCCGHLLTALNLLNGPGLPGVDGLLDCEHVVAHMFLEAALNLAKVSAALAITALWLVR